MITYKESSDNVPTTLCIQGWDVKVRHVASLCSYGELMDELVVETNSYIYWHTQGRMRIELLKIQYC